MSDSLLASIISMVYTETNRPDLVNETLQAVTEATLTAHLSEYWFKDIVEGQVTFTDPTQYIQTLDLTTLPQFRNVAYFRKNVPGPTAYAPAVDLEDSSYGTTVTVNSDSLVPWGYIYQELDEYSPDDLIDIYGWERGDIYYIAGTNMNIRSTTPLGNGQLGYYSFPLVGQGNYASWIASLYPYVIVYAAAGAVLGKIGQDSAIKYYLDPQIGAATKQMSILRATNIIAKGR